jgi:hypothetical protein
MTQQSEDSWPQTQAWWIEGAPLVDRWDEVEFDYVPFRLYVCPVCGALLQSDSTDRHKAWHLGESS